MEFNLREISESDLSFINQWRNDSELVDLLGNNFLYIAQEVDKLWYDQYLKTRTSNIRLTILEKENYLPIGTVQLTNIHNINRSAEFSIMIGNKNYWSKGAGSFASKHLIEHGFLNLNLNRIYLTVLETNRRALTLYEKIGFKKEGTLRQAIFKNGDFNNLIEMSILRQEFNL